MMRSTWILLMFTLCLLANAAAGEEAAVTTLEEELRAAENAFAATMAQRDLEAFRTFLAAEVVFFTGETELRGRDAVVAVWADYFETPVAPFSWRPEAVAVLESGTLGFSSGPVLDREGKRIGTFNSVWRRNDDGKWEIIFDRGCPPCGGD